MGVNFKALNWLFRVFCCRLNFKSPSILSSCQIFIFTFVFRLEKLAEANRNRVILEAEAEAEALRVRGEAEAFAVEAKARAEAEQMAKKADAWKDYKEAAMVDMLLETLPKVQLRFLVAKLTYTSDFSNLVNT
jgi:hypothetical protein